MNWLRILKYLVIILGLGLEGALVVFCLVITALSQNTDFSETLKAVGGLFLFLSLIIIGCCWLLVRFINKKQKSTS